MKAIDGYDKLRGGYYTPTDIADFIICWTHPAQECRILEPSCGDGSFLAALRERNYNANVTGIELDPNEAKKAEQYGYTVEQGDFFSFYDNYIEGKSRYDIIIGNPPFIR